MITHMVVIEVIDMKILRTLSMPTSLSFVCLSPFRSNLVYICKILLKTFTLLSLNTCLFTLTRQNYVYSSLKSKNASHTLDMSTAYRQVPPFSQTVVTQPETECGTDFPVCSHLIFTDIIALIL